MKRAAICISGHFRTFSQTHQNYIENIITPLNKEGYLIDVFIHTWSKLGPSKTGSTFRPGSDELSCLDTPLDLIREIYKPVYLFVEDYELIKDNFKTKKYTENGYNGIYDKEHDGILYQIPAYYKRHMCNHIKSIHEHNNGFKYDVVFVYRPDTVFENPINLTGFEEKKLYVWNLNHDLEMFFDQFIYGDSKTIDCFTGIFLNLRDIFNREEHFGPEKGLYLHTVKDNQIIATDTNNPFKTLRPDGILQ